MFYQERNINSIKSLDTPPWIYIYNMVLLLFFLHLFVVFIFAFLKKMELIHVEESFEIVMNESEIVMR